MSIENNTLTDADVEKYVSEIAAKKYAEMNPKSEEPTTPSNDPAPIVLNIAGKEMTFKDTTEASAVLTSVYQEQTRAPRQEGRQVTSDADTNTWTAEDQSKYVELLVKNPIQAQEYIDEKRFGVKNPTEVIRGQMAATANLATQMTIDRFVAENKDYYVCPENGVIMQDLLKKYGGQVTPDTLEAAYAIADKRGLLKKAEAEAPKERSYNPYLAAPPMAGRSNSGGFSPNFERDAEAMSSEQLQEMIMRLSG